MSPRPVTYAIGRSARKDARSSILLCNVPDAITVELLRELRRLDPAAALLHPEAHEHNANLAALIEQIDA